MNEDPITEEALPAGPAAVFIDAWVAERHRAGYVYTEQLLEIARGLAAQIDGLVGRCEELETDVAQGRTFGLAWAEEVASTVRRVEDVERRLALAEQVGVQTAATWTASVADVVPDVMRTAVVDLGDSTAPLIKPVSTGTVAVKGRHARVKGGKAR